MNKKFFVSSVICALLTTSTSAIGANPSQAWDPSQVGWEGNLFALVSVVGIGIILCVVLVREALNFYVTAAWLAVAYFWWRLIVGSELASWVVTITLLGYLVRRTNQPGESKIEDNRTEDLIVFRDENRGSKTEKDLQAVSVAQKTSRNVAQATTLVKPRPLWYAVSHGLTHKPTGIHLDMHSVRKERFGWSVTGLVPQEIVEEINNKFIPLGKVDQLQLMDGRYSYGCPSCDGRQSAASKEKTIPFPLEVKLQCDHCGAFSVFRTGKYPDYSSGQ
jgi:hypothetical protein